MRRSGSLARSTFRFLVSTLAALLVAGAVVSVPVARAAELAEQVHSLKSVPADAAFYSASLRLKEQLNIFLESKAYDRLMQNPLVQLGKMQAQFQLQQNPQPAIAKVRAFLQSPAGKEAIAVVQEMVSEEIFLYGNADVARSLELLMELNSAGQELQKSVIAAKAEGESDEEIKAEQAKVLLEKYGPQLEALKIPDIVWGFRIQDGARAVRQLDQIHEALTTLLTKQEKPALAALLKREQIAGHEFLTFRLDGTLVPWDELRSEAEDVDDETFDKWKELLNKKTLTVAIGVVGEFVVASVGSSTAPLEHFGEGAVLASHPALARLNKHADQRVTSVSYASKEIAAAMGSPQRTIDNIVDTVDTALSEAEIEESSREALLEDVRGFGKDLLKFFPTPGEWTGLSFLTPRGYEGFRYQSGTQPAMDSSQPLDVLKQAGGNPMMLFASHAQDSSGDYDRVVSWIKRIAGHVEKIAEEKSDEEQWAKYQEFRGRGIELLQRIDTANRDQLIPALKANQSAVVLDVAAQSHQWFAQMPESPTPLPMLEFGLAWNVNDAEKLRAGIKTYFDVVKETISLLHEAHPDEMEEFELPSPEKHELAEGGAVYSYAAPEEWGVDTQIALNGGLTNNVGAVSLFPGFTERLLIPTPLAIDTSLDVNRAAAVVTYVQPAKFIEAVRPWIDYGFGVAMGQIKHADEEEAAEDEPAEPSPFMMQAGFILPQIHQMLDVAMALKSASAVIYEEDGVWVTHSETHLEDLK